MNEFGQGGDEEEVESKQAAKPLVAPAGGKVTDSDGKLKGELDGKAEGAVSSAKEKAGGRKRKV